MVGHFFRLKLRLTRNRLKRSGTWGVIGFVLIWLGAAFLGFLLGLVAYGAGYLWGGDGLALVLSVVALGWLVIPVVAAALDETVDPRRLELLPLTRGRLAAGLLASAAIGPGTVITVLVAVGGAVWSFTGLASVVPIVIAALLFVVWCLASSRLVTSLLTDLLRSRRGRDLAVVAASLAIGVSVILTNLYRPGPGDFAGETLPIGGLGTVLGWTPAGAMGAAMSDFGADGDPGTGVARVVYVLAATGVVVWLWQLVLGRLSTRTAVTSKVRTVGEAVSLVPRIFQGRSGPVYVTAGKELRYMRRDPRFRSQAVGLVIALAAIGFGAGQFLLGTEYAPFLATVIAWMVASTGFNLFGMDDRSFWAYVVSGVDLRRILAGKNLALALIGVPAVGFVAVLMSLIAGEFAHLLTAVLSSLAVLAVWLGVGNVTSVLGAFPMPESNLFGSRNASLAAGAVALGGVLAAGALTVPVAAVVGVPAAMWGPWQGLVGAVVAGGLGWLAYRLSLNVAGGLLDSRAEKLLEVLDKPPV
jgi:ABC-2 type transport system permease protein